MNEIVIIALSTLRPRTSRDSRRKSQGKSMSPEFACGLFIPSLLDTLGSPKTEVLIYNCYLHLVKKAVKPTLNLSFCIQIINKTRMHPQLAKETPSSLSRWPPQRKRRKRTKSKQTPQQTLR